MRNWAFLFLLPVLSLSAQAEPTQNSGAPQPSIDEVCAKTACRKGGFEVAVRVDAQHFSTVPVTRSPYVLDDGGILIFPGETLMFQLAVDGEKLGRPTFVKALAPEIPAKIATDEKVVVNPDDASLSPLPQKSGDTDYAALPPDTIVISYGDMSDFYEKGDKPDKMATEPGKILIVSSNLSRPFKYDATMFVIKIGKGGYAQSHTSTCTVMPHAGGSEMWPDPMGPMILENFRFVSDSDKTCQ
jgi:hypothetical protein